MKVIAIGGVAASMSAVSKLKRLKPDTEIVVYEEGEVLSYGACGLPYYVSDEIKDASKLVARTKEQFKEKGIQVYIKHHVDQVFDEEKKIKVTNLETNQSFEDTYDKLIIGTGAHPILPPWNGVKLNNIFTLGNYKDGLKLKEALEDPAIKDVTIIGAGFIGVEMIEAFHTRKKNIRVIQLDPQLLPLFDPEMMDDIESYLVKEGVELHLNESVVSFKGDKKVEQVVTDQDSYNTDLVLVSIGVNPNTKFLKSSNIELAANGAVLVNKQMETNIKDIYAGGDCSMIHHILFDEARFIPMGHNANKQGRIIAQNIADDPIDFKGVLGTTVIKIIDREAGKTGLSEKEAKMLDLDYDTVTITGRNHAGYYPNPEKIKVKVVYENKTHKILGAQLVGGKGAALRINIFAVAITANMTTDDLSFLDLAYAPPFSGVWDITQVATQQVK
jgi:NADPH-dependent 2,4-dienoyl-CoA reductase/sulfur reductase-like enzyme